LSQRKYTGKWGTQPVGGRRARPFAAVWKKRWEQVKKWGQEATGGCPRRLEKVTDGLGAARNLKIRAKTQGGGGQEWSSANKNFENAKKNWDKRTWARGKGKKRCPTVLWGKHGPNMVRETGAKAPRGSDPPAETGT